MSQPTPQEQHIDVYAETDTERAIRLRREGKKGGEIVKALKAETDRRESLGKEGKAFKNPDGHFSYPTETKDEIKKAIEAIGRAPGSEKGAIKAYIKRRANAEGVSIPESWGGTSKADGDVDVLVSIWKDESQRIVYGVALQPDVVDSQGDIVSAAEIEKAAHAFLVHRRQTDVQHAEEQVPVDIVESYIAPQDMEVAGQQVAKGSWVMAHKVNDDGIWNQVLKGELTGLSIGGSAVRSEETA